jgi:hypothetical protein
MARKHGASSRSTSLSGNYSNSIGRFDKIFGYAALPTPNDFA